MSIFALRSNGLASSAYKNLSRTQSSLNSNIGRLSSGLRIGSAADDSAGSNVSVRMKNQIKGMSQANRNAQNANNLLATAESGLSDISDILSKMRELSVQAATDTLNDNDRSSIDLEFQSLKDELTRIANVTEYNGMNVLNGTYQEGGGSEPASLFSNQNKKPIITKPNQVPMVIATHTVMPEDLISIETVHRMTSEATGGCKLVRITTLTTNTNLAL